MKVNGWPRGAVTRAVRAPDNRRRRRHSHASNLALATVFGVVASLGATSCSSHESEGSVAATTEGAGAIDAVVYRSSTCGCCKSYEEYLRRHGFRVKSEVTEDMDAVKSARGIPVDAQSCHTTMVGAYAIEGHVPVEAIRKLLDEHPDVDGIAVPGMPSNSPGMGEPDGVPLEVLTIDDGHTAPFTKV